MRRQLLLVLALAAIGCGEQQAAVTSDGAPPPSSVAVSQKQLLAPDFDKPSKLALKRRSGSVRVGMSFDDALLVFAEPPGSYEKSDLPPAIPAPTFEARGWQTKNEGFGMILSKSRVAAAIYELDHTTADRVDEAVALHGEEFGQVTPIQGKYVRYWFWKSPEPGTDQLLMICSSEIQAGKLNLTEAIGTQSLMDALRMTPEAAASDLSAAERRIDKQRAGKKGNPVNSSNLGAG